MDWLKQAVRDEGRLLVISGPAASGKTTVCKRLQEAFPSIRRVVTATTRPPRGSERQGIDYHFLDREDFKRRIREDSFIEWAEVHGNLYGTPVESVLRPLQDESDLLLNIDVQGAETLRRKADSNPLLRNRMATLFILPPSMEELRRRIVLRGRDPETEIEDRLQTALQEMEMAGTYDYILVSGSYDQDAQRAAAVWQAEKMRNRRANG